MPTDAEAFAADAMLVVAHPDDEALWFSSILGRVPKLVITYMEERDQPCLLREREAVRDAYPLASADWLSVRGSGNFGREVWDGELNTFGVRLEGAREDQRAYELAYHELLARLRPLVIEARPARLVTHAPWGEYGHADHAQVFRAVEQIASELGIPVWFPLYCSPATYYASRRWIHDRSETEIRRLACNTELAHQLRDLYIDKGCWTWDRDFRWFPSDTFVRADRHGPGGGATEMNLIVD